MQARLDEELNALRAKLVDVELQEEEIARRLETVEALTGQFDAEMLGFRNWLTGASSDPIWRTGVNRSPDAIERQLELMRKFRDTIKAKHSDLQNLEQLSIILERILLLCLYRYCTNLHSFRLHNEAFTVDIIVSKSMGMAGPGIEPASSGATAQEQPSLRYQSPAHCDLYATL